MSPNRLENLQPQAQEQAKPPDQPHCWTCNQSFTTQRKLNDHLKFSIRHQPSTLWVPGKNTPPRQPGKAALSSGGNPKLEDQSPKISLAKDGKSGWSVIPEVDHPAVLEALRIRVHRESTLQTNSYITKPFDPKDYVDRRKCMRCKTKEKDVVGRECRFHPKPLSKPDQADPFSERTYTCCTSPPTTPGCTTAPTHQFSQNYQYTTHKDYLPTPPPSLSTPKYRAVVLDCEMAGVSTGGPGEAILLCASDYLTGAVLINKYISPPEKITIMRTTIHGISRYTLNSAIQRGDALAGWSAARAELWKFIDDRTILIGHALEHDLNSLRLIHPRIVDSGVLVRNIVGCTFGLKLLCEELLHIRIRKNKGGVHDCLEDVLATREVVLFCTRNRKVFRAWGEGKKGEEERKRVERVKKNEEVKAAKLQAQLKAKEEGMSEEDKLKKRVGEEMVKRVAEAREERRKVDVEAKERKELRKEVDGKRLRGEKEKREEEEALKVFKRTAESRGLSVR